MFTSKEQNINVKKNIDNKKVYLINKGFNKKYLSKIINILLFIIFYFQYRYHVIILYSENNQNSKILLSNCLKLKILI